MVEFSGPLDNISVKLGDDEPTIRFTIDMDSTNLTPDNIVSEVVGNLPVKNRTKTRTGDIRVVMDSEKMTTSDISTLMDNIAEAESNGVEFYDVRVGI